MNIKLNMYTSLSKIREALKGKIYDSSYAVDK